MSPHRGHNNRRGEQGRNAASLAPEPAPISHRAVCRSRSAEAEPAMAGDSPLFPTGAKRRSSCSGANMALDCNHAHRPRSRTSRRMSTAFWVSGQLWRAVLAGVPAGPTQASGAGRVARRSP
jgi:hypothetical protein